MPQCIVIADDLTGGNATGILLKRNGLSTMTMLNLSEAVDENTYDCIVYPTDSRAVSKEIAYERVYSVIKLLQRPDTIFSAKRIDSTLRGNLGRETDAMLDYLGEEYMAFVVQCYPDAKRILVGGYLLVNGVALHKTEAAIDPKNPIDTSRPRKLFERQSKYLVDSVHIEDLLGGVDEVVRIIQQKRSRGVRILIFDCISQEDIDLISDAVIQSKVPFVAVDPGTFTATVAGKIVKPINNKRNQGKVLATVGSVNGVAKAQMEELFVTMPVYNVYVDAKCFLESEKQCEIEISRVTDQILSKADDYEILAVTGLGILPENRINFTYYKEIWHCQEEELSRRINAAFAEITARIIENDDRFRGLFTCGGDITVAVCKRFEASGLRLHEEVVPLAVCGEIMDGPRKGIHLLTKGGMVGDKQAIVECIRYLKQKINLT